MVKLEITNKNKYIYELKDETKRSYNINIEFFDMEGNPEIGDYIYLNEKLLNSKYEGYSTSYTFGGLENQYGKENILMEDADVIKLVKDDKEIYLKRLYG